MPPITHANDTIPVEVFFPLAFRDTGDNRIVDPDGVLQPVLERLRRVRAHFSSDTVRIVHIGDSHVRGHIYPRQVGTRLVQTFGEVNYTDMGVNGATCLTFTHPERIRQIAELKPELLILSFGTNESYNRRYDAAAHYRQMDELVTLLREALPGVPILLTTPPGSYDRGRRRRGVRTYTINPRVPTAAIAIRRYAADHQLAVWDLFDVAGGSRRACANWTNARLMRPDHVHFFAEGYVLQGDLLYEALIKAYNDYVSTLQ
jgi:lysophospholipase L1-like esterase